MGITKYSRINKMFNNNILMYNESKIDIKEWIAKHNSIVLKYKRLKRPSRKKRINDKTFRLFSKPR